MESLPELRVVSHPVTVSPDVEILEVLDALEGFQRVERNVLHTMLLFNS